MAITQGAQFRLRAGAPMPIGTAQTFKLHTFGSETNLVDMYDCTTSLPASSEFRGQGLGGDYISASFSKLGAKEGSYLQGRTVYAPTYGDEEDFNLL